MIVSVPASTDATLPDTGQSMSPEPVRSTAAPTSMTVPGSTVEVSTATDPALIPSTTPCSPRYTERRASSSARLVRTMSPCDAASAAVGATVTGSPS